MNSPQLGARLAVAIASPGHSSLAARTGGLLHYSHTHALAPGSLVRVPLGQREVLGVVWPEPAASVQDKACGQTSAPQPTLKPIASVLAALAPLSTHWLNLVSFAAGYYQREVGEVAMAALPPQLRELSDTQLSKKATSKRLKTAAAATADTAPTLSAEQTQVLAEWAQGPQPALLWGSTGSGKTEVYLHAVMQLLAQNPSAQALVLVPEINLTPQLTQRFAERFAELGPQAVVSMHSALTPAQRLNAWWQAHRGHCRVLLGTRLAVFASLPNLRLVVVDEEHDPSYKAQDGLRHSARDLAVWRAKNEGIPVLLGSATPSLESWVASEPEGRYQRLQMPSRLGQGSLPQLQLIDMRREPRDTLVSDALLNALTETAARGEQSLILLNRRGYASVLHCPDCAWKSECPNCSAYQVFHKGDRSLRCHHCSMSEPVPRACPSCGSVDVHMLGKGTERLEEHLGRLLGDLRRPNGDALRLGRIDADSTRLSGSLQAQLAAVHSGEVDVLIGTQMVAKGHDFRRVSTVGVLGLDAALFSSDFRAAERLFALLMQVAGRAGRDAALSGHSRMWVQTHAANHPLFAHLARWDFAGFANQQLAERAQAQLPPHVFHALLRCESRSQEANLALLQQVHAWMLSSDASASAEYVTVYAPLPANPQRVANMERSQLLLESQHRKALQHTLQALRPLLQSWAQALKGPMRVARWAIDVDPNNL